MIIMDMENTRRLLEEILSYSLYTDDNLSTELKSKLNSIITFLNQNTDKINFLKRLEQYRSNNNAYAFDRYLSIIINKLELTTTEKLNLLNLDIPYYQTLGLWNKLNTPTKLNYLDSKNFLSKLDIKRINYTINNKKDMLEKLVNPIIKKIPENSLILNDLPKDLITKKDLFSKLCDNVITNYINKYYYLGSDLNKLINTGLIRYAKNYSITLYNLDKDTLMKSLNITPTILAKLNPELTIKLIDKDYLASLLTHNFSHNLNNTIKELNMLSNNNTKYLTRDYLEKCPNNSIYLYSPDDKLLNLFKNNYTYLLKLHNDTLVYLVNNKFSEEERVSLLRNQIFVNNLPDNYLEAIINKMTFPNVFNMLQNITILSKMKNINVSLRAYDKIFITGYLDSPALVNITDNKMLNNMFSLISPIETSKYLSYPYIYTKFKTYDIVNILINSKLNIYTDSPKLLKVLRLDEIKYYLNKLISNDAIRYDLLFNDYTLKTILGINISLSSEEKEDIKYLYDLILIRGNTTLECNTSDLESFKSIIASYHLFGLTKTKELYENGNQYNSLEEVNKIGTSFVSYFFKNFNDQINIEEILSIITSKDFKNPKLITLINKMNTYKYSNITNTKEVLKNYLEYSKISKENAYQTIKTFLINYNNYLEEYQMGIYAKRFLKIKYQNYRLKDNLYYAYQEKYTKEFIKLKKLEAFSSFLSDNKSYSTWFIKDNTNLINTLNDYLSRYNYKLDITLDKIIKPFLKGLSISDIISNLGYNRPAYYEIIKYERIEKIKLTKINNKLKGILKKFNNADKIILLNYLAYGLTPNIIIDKETLVRLNKYKQTITNFNGKVNVNKIELKLDYISIINLTNDLELKNYSKIYIETINIINYFKGLASKYISTDIIKQVYKDEYIKGLNDYIIPINSSDSDIVLIKHKMYLDKFKMLFSKISLEKEIKLSEEVKNRLIEIIPYLIDNYFTDLTYNYSVLFKNNITLEDINNWNKIIALFGQKN